MILLMINIGKLLVIYVKKLDNFRFRQPILLKNYRIVMIDYNQQRLILVN